MTNAKATRYQLRIRTLTFLVALFFCFSLNAQSATSAIEKLLKDHKATASITLLGIDSGKEFHYQDSLRLPMLSVYKFPIALFVLHQVDEKTISLTDEIPLSTKNLLPNTHSPLRDQLKPGTKTASIKELLYYMVSLSDNNACDILLNILGGTRATEKFIHSLGIDEFQMPYTEEEMHIGWGFQYSNYSTTRSLALLTKKFYEEKILSRESTDLLFNIMRSTSTGPDKIKKYLPLGTVANKTGTSGQNSFGMTAAENDLAIIKANDGTSYALVIFISDSWEAPEKNKELIAKISQELYVSYPNLNNNIKNK